MNDIEYSLLELIENPKRINNIPHCRLFDYVLQAKESQDRFESFILTLYNFHYYAAFGFSLMYFNSIIATTKIAKSTLKILSIVYPFNIELIVSLISE